MKILMESWKRFINEEIKPSSRLEQYISMYPPAKKEKYRKLYGRLVEGQVPYALKKIKEGYLNPAHAQAFVRLIQNIKGVSHTKEDILKNYKVYRNTALEALKNVPVIVFHDKIDEVDPKYFDAVGFYDHDKRKIFINPFRIQQRSREFGRRFDHGMLGAVLEEEYLHAIQYFIYDALKMPMASMQTRLARGETDRFHRATNLFLPQEQTGLNKEAYDYLTTPKEFHAKLLRLKFRLLRENPANFDGNGRLKKEVLVKLMREKTRPPVLKVLNPNKIDEVLRFFDMVAKAKGPRLTQQQRTS